MVRAVDQSAISAYSLGAVIRKYREEACLNQGALSSLLNVNKNTVCNWENNKCKPDTDAIRKICSVLHIPIQELFDIHDTQDKLTSDETILLSNYRSMSSKAQRLALRAIIGISEEDARIQANELRNGYYVMGLQNTKAAAGSGCPFADDTEIEHCFVKVSKLSNKADTLVIVSGSSMEPVYNNGDILFVEYTEDALVDDDLICSSADGVVVKRMGTDGILHSVNTALPYGKKYEDDHVRVIGKVIGVAREDDIAATELVPVLEELLSEEVIAFDKKHNS